MLSQEVYFMPRPPVDKLLEKVPSKYQLVMVIAKRAKQLTDKRVRFLRENDANPVYKAMEEIAADTVTLTPASEEDANSER